MMRRADAHNYLKSQLADYLQRITGEIPRHGRNLHCIFHDDRTPSMTYYADTLRVYCQACGKNGDIFDVIGYVENLSRYQEQYRRCAEIYGVDTGDHATSIMPADKPKKPQEPQEPPRYDFTDYFEECADRIDMIMDYLTKRGITRETAKRFRLGYDPAFNPSKHVPGKEVSWTQPRLIIPTGYSFAARRRDSDTSAKYFKPEGMHTEHFNPEVLYTVEYAFVTEGYFDAMALEQCGFHAMALGASKSAIPGFLQALDERPPSAVLLLALDHDDNETGQQATRDLMNGLRERKVAFLLADEVIGDHKDPAEFLQADEKSFIDAANVVVSRVRNYLAEMQFEAEKEKTRAVEAYNTNARVLEHMDDFERRISDPNANPPQPTFIGRLDYILGGGLYPGLHVLGAASSLGKTTFILQLADQIAQGGTPSNGLEHKYYSGRDVLFFTLEMSRTQLISKSISRITAMRAPAGDRTKDIRMRLSREAREVEHAWRFWENEQKRGHLAEAIKVYKEHIAPRMYIIEEMMNFGALQIYNAVEEHIRRTGNRPVIFIDYLQALEPENDRATDKQATDETMECLKAISRGLELPLVVISSLNRSSYKGRVTMAAFKESGKIEYGADVLLGLQPTMNDIEADAAASARGNEVAKQEMRERDPKCRAVEITMLKNRLAPVGPGSSVSLEYLPAYNLFESLDEPGVTRPR